jgi:hypothetical protein
MSIRNKLSVLLLLLTGPALADGIFNGGGGGGGGGVGTVTSVGGGCASVAAPNPITSAGTITAVEMINPQTGATYTIANADCGTLTNFTNAGAVAVTLPQAGAASQFIAGWYADYRNSGSGIVTITPATSTIDTIAYRQLLPGQAARIVSDGTNYTVLLGVPGSVIAPSHPGYVAANWYQPLNSGSFTNGAAATASVIKCTFGQVGQRLTISSLGTRISTLAAAGNIQLALYSNVTGRPGLLLSSTPSISTAAAGAFNAALGANQQVGVNGANGTSNLWWCINADNSTVVVNGLSGGTAAVGYIGGTQVNAGASNSLVNMAAAVSCAGAACTGGSSTFGTWPATLVGTTWTIVADASAPQIEFLVNSVP